jgi:DNA-binding CsgD family transcriptional regulator
LRPSGRRSYAARAIGSAPRARARGEVRGLSHDTRLGIKFQLDLNLVADLHTGGLSVGVAETKQEAATHEGDPAPPRVPVDRDRHPRSLALSKRLHDLRGLIHASADTPREHETLGLIAQGYSNAASAMLVVTEGTVAEHIRNIFDKLNLPESPDQHRRVLAVLTYLRVAPAPLSATARPRLWMPTVTPAPTTTAPRRRSGVSDDSPIANSHQSVCVSLTAVVSRIAVSELAG